MIQRALELAVAQARRDATTRDAPPPPKALGPVLRFNRLPRTALRTVRSVVDGDDAFRRRVADGVAEADLDRGSWLFLTRPEGWSQELELIEAAAAELDEDEQRRREEQRAERRASQLDDVVQRLRDEVDELRSALDAASADLEHERSLRRDTARERDELATRATALDEQRTAAIRSLKTTESISAERLAALRQARAELAAALERADAGGPAALGTGDADPRAVEAAAHDPSAAGSAAGSAGEGSAASTEPAIRTAPTDAALTDAAVPVDSAVPVDAAMLAGVADEVARGGAAASELAAALDAIAGALRSLGVSAAPGGGLGTAAHDRTATGERAGGGDVAAHRGTPGDGAAVRRSSTRPPRRTPIRLRRGATEDSVEGIDQLLRTSGAVVVVDGYNVAMEGWPTLSVSAQRDSLLAALGTVRSRTGANVHVVFDGDAGGERPAVGASLPVRVHFSPAEVEADDVILEMVAQLPTDVGVVVVSSDRRVADGARRLGANAVRSGDLLDYLRR